MADMMWAAVYRGIDDVRLERLPIPRIGAGEVLIQVAACGVCGTDLKKIRHGLVAPPRVFGHETAGTIVEVGAGVRGWRVGDRVAVMHHVPCLSCYYCEQRAFAQCPGYKKTGVTAGFEPAGGGYAEYVRAMDWIVERGLVRLPDGASFEEATFIEPVNTVLKAVEKVGLAAGQTACVVGQGQIGLLFTQLLSSSRVHVLGVDPLEGRRAVSLSMGAAAVFDPGDPGLAEAARERTDGRGLDAAFIAAPSEDAVRLGMELVRPGGVVLLFAHTRLGDAVEVDGGAVCMLEKSVIGSYSSDITLQQRSAELIFDGTLRVRDLITHRFPLAEVSEAIALAGNPSHGALKVMVDP